MPKRWISQIVLLALWLAGALLLGLLFGRPGWWVTGALALYLAHTLRYVYRLDRALEGGKSVPMLETRGLWAEIFGRVARLKGKARNRKKKYHRLLREVRESTGALSDGGIILNGAHEILWFNPAATRLLGLDPARDIGNRIDNLLRHPDFVSYLAAPTGEGVVVPSPERDGGWLTVQLIPYGQEQYLAIVRDVTREHMLETTRRDFVANASHELRSPLTVVSGYLDSLAEGEDVPPSWAKPIGEMQRQVVRMTQILRDLIELTRLESADPRAPQSFVDVGGMLEAIAKDFPRSDERPRLTLRLETDAALLGSESELHSIFFNLVNNAMRFTPATGSVEVVWRLEADGSDTGAGAAGAGVGVGVGVGVGAGARAGAGVDAAGAAGAGFGVGGGRAAGAVFEVVDTGIGIPKEQIPRITERFYRVDPGRSRATGGTGLGLAIVKHALQRHGATLSIRSREGEGSTFSCRFPAARVTLRPGGAKRPGTSAAQAAS